MTTTIERPRSFKLPPEILDDLTRREFLLDEIARRNTIYVRPAMDGEPDMEAAE